MSVKSILVLTVFMSFGIYNSIQAEIIRGVNIPELNVAKIVGEWNLVASTNSKDQDVHLTNIVKQQSERTFTMNMTAVLRPDMRKSGDNNVIIYGATLTATMKSDSNIIIATGGDAENTSSSQSLVIIQVVENSFMVMYRAKTVEDISTGTDGNVYIFSRTTNLSNSILQDVMSNNFYRQGVQPQNILMSIDYTVCQ